MTQATMGNTNKMSIENKFTDVTIHPTSYIDENAVIGAGTTIGPWCMIGPNVVIGKNNTIKSNVIIEGKTTIGDNNTIHQFVIIGNKSHDLKFTAEQATTVTIGNDCDIREFTNIHAGTPNGARGTWIGNHVFLMSHNHVGHDCEINDGALLSQGVTLGGEVIIQKKAIIGGCTAIHQFCTIGKYAMVGGCAGISKDVIPYAMTSGVANMQSLDGLNMVGLKRNNFSIDDIRTIKNVYKALFISNEGLWVERLAMAKSVYGGNPVADDIFNFIEHDSRRIVCKPISKSAKIDES